MDEFAYRDPYSASRDALYFVSFPSTGVFKHGANATAAMRVLHDLGSSDPHVRRARFEWLWNGITSAGVHALTLRCAAL